MSGNNNLEMMEALQALAVDKGISVDDLLAALADALESAWGQACFVEARKVATGWSCGADASLQRDMDAFVRRWGDSGWRDPIKTTSVGKSDLVAILSAVAGIEDDAWHMQATRRAAGLFGWRPDGRSAAASTRLSESRCPRRNVADYLVRGAIVELTAIAIYRALSRELESTCGPVGGCRVRQIRRASKKHVSRRIVRGPAVERTCRGGFRGRRSDGRRRGPSLLHCQMDPVVNDDDLERSGL